MADYTLHIFPDTANPEMKSSIEWLHRHPTHLQLMDVDTIIPTLGQFDMWLLESDYQTLNIRARLIHTALTTEINPYDDRLLGYAKVLKECLAKIDHALHFRELRDGFIYVVKVYLSRIDDVGTAYKIGRTANPKDRLKTFEVKLPYPIAYKSVHKFPDMIYAESYLHRLFKDRRIEGEWFDLTEHDLSQFETLF